MLQRAPVDRKLHVLVATPAGVAGKGGIDRIMGALAGEIGRQNQPGLFVRFAASRGGGRVVLSPFFLAAFMLRLIGMKLGRRLDVVHPHRGRQDDLVHRRPRGRRRLRDWPL